MSWSLSDFPLWIIFGGRWGSLAVEDLYSPRKDSDPEMIPILEMIPNLTPKWSRPQNGAHFFRLHPEMIPN